MRWTSIIKKTLLFLLRFVLAVLLIVVAFAVGAMIGYSIIGDGSDPTEIFNPELWEHILGFVFN